MAKWRESVMTECGEELLAEAVKGDSNIQFEKVSIGCGIYTEEEKSEEFLKKQSDLKQAMNEYPVSSILQDKNIVTLKVLMGNASVTKGYSITEMGLWARRQGSSDELELYSIILADSSDYFPDSTTPTTVIHAFQMVFASSNVRVNITENMGAYVSVEDFKEAVQKVYENANEFTLAKIAELINGAPATADTLKEIADLIADNKLVVDALDAAIGKKANQSELDTHVNNSTIHFTSSERTKLAGIAAGANKYTHPASAAGAKASGLYKITTDATGHVTGAAAVTKADITGLGIPGANTTYSTGTASTAGLTKLYTSVGTGTDGTMTRAAITNTLKWKTAVSSQGINNQASLSSITSSYNDIIVEVICGASEPRYVYTWNIARLSLPSGSQQIKRLLSGYSAGTFNGYCEVVINTSYASIVTARVSNKEYTGSNVTLMIYYR